MNYLSISTLYKSKAVPGLLQYSNYPTKLREFSILFICFICFAPVFAQSKADSLLEVIGQAKGQQKVELTLQLNKSYYSDLKSSATLFLQHTHEAIEIADSLQDKDSLSKLLLNLGNLHQSLGNNKEALENYFRLLSIYENGTSMDSASIKIGDAYNNIGIIYKRQGEVDKALNYYQRALKYASGQNSSLRGTLYTNIGAIYRIKNEYNVALDYYHKAIMEHEKAGNTKSTVVPLQNIGILYGFMGQPKKSLEFLHKALEVRKINNDIEGICYNHVNIGDAYKRDGQFDKAIYHLNEALDISRQKGYKLLTAHALLYLSETYAGLGEHQKAHAILEQHIVYKDSLVNEQSAEKMAEMEAKYNFDTQQKEIVLLKAQQGLKEAELKKKQLLNYALAAGVAFSLILLFLIYRQYRLKKRTNEILERYNKDIKQKNIDLEEVNHKLKVSEKELRQLNSTKDKFFSILSHDLRSPLNSFAGLLELISSSSASLSKEELVHLTSKLNASVKNLSSLLNNLLQWSMAQMNRLECKPENIALQQLIADNTALIKLAAENKGIEVYTCVEEGLTVVMDKNMLDFVMRNLLSNAVKFTPRGGKISISAESRDNQVVLSVRDTGVGIPEENLKRLFKIGENISTQGTAKESGTGLGLILCKEFVERNGGSISVVSKVSDYTSFIITVPALLSHSPTKVLAGEAV